MEKGAGATPEGLMTAQEAADYLGYAIGTLYNKVAAREIPHLRIAGHTLRFRRSDLDAWLDEHRVEVSASDTVPPAA